MMKTLILAAAFAGLAIPAATANGIHKTQVITKRVAPVIAVAPNTRRAVQNSRRTHIVRGPVVAVSAPRITVAVPGVRIGVVPVVTKRVATARTRAVVVRR